MIAWKSFEVGHKQVHKSRKKNPLLSLPLMRKILYKYSNLPNKRKANFIDLSENEKSFHADCT